MIKRSRLQDLNVEDCTNQSQLIFTPMPTKQLFSKTRVSVGNIFTEEFEFATPADSVEVID